MKKKPSFTLGLIQERVTPDIEKNVELTQQRIREAKAKGAQIICLQELFASPYFCTVETIEHFALAETLPSSRLSSFQDLARKLEVVIVYPFFERRGPGVYHNSSAVIDADGEVLGVYRKMHIPDDPLYYEKFFFAPGDAEGEASGFRVFQTRYATLGVLICWDQWYPEAARITSLLGAEVLLYPTAIGWHPAERETFGKDQHAAWHTIQRSHAIANGVYVAATNRYGHEETPGTDGITFFGQSFVSDPFGRILAQAPADRSEIVVVECQRKLVEETRQLWPFLRDRRIDAYRPICSRFLTK